MSDLRPAPYPADTRAKGWRFELDHERIRQSDTWALAPADLRPWLLMLWMTAWEQMPCGSLPNEDDLIAARIGMSAKLFAKHRRFLMRGWWQAEDGRLYHNIIAERVTEMVARKEKEKTRKAAYRQRMDAERDKESQGSPEMSHGTDMGHTRDSRGSDPGSDATGTGTGTGLKTKNLSVPDGTDADASPAGMDSKDAIFHVVVPWLVERGVPDKNARSLMGGAVKQLGSDGAWELGQQLIREKPLEPASWLATSINARMPAGTGKKASRHSGFDKVDYREGVNPDGTF